MSRDGLELPRSVFFVGAGSVAVALAGGLRLAGVSVHGMWGRSAVRAKRAASLAGVPAYSGAFPLAMQRAGAVVVAVRDAAISSMAERLAAAGLVGERQVLLHCSGAISAERAFAAVRECVEGVGVIHPLRAIPDGEAAMEELADTVFGVQGDAIARSTALRWVRALEGRPILLTAEQMSTYHAAAVMASNYLVSLVDMAAVALSATGLSRSDSVAALLPLMAGTVENLAVLGLPGALTGPMRRGDRETVARHLKALAELPPEISAGYRLLGRRNLALARECGDAAPELLDEIEEMLADRTK